tara:strand:- start:338 stop:799 length:462 start_codon:yes stop_codon:yes gene_type:complete
MEYQKKEIVGFKKYEIDTVGNVFTSKKSSRLKSTDGKLSVRRNSAGYHQVVLYSNKKSHQVLVHRLMWETLVGPIPKGMTIDHIDQDYKNNQLQNLQLMSHSDNIKKMWDVRGRSKKKDVVLDWIARGYNRKFISENLNISTSYISMIANGKR